jgi:periplasmic protein TonB
MATLRIPFAFVSGLLFSLAAFFGLWQLVGAPLDVRPLVEARDIVFTPQIVETPIETTREPRIVRDPPVLEPTLPTISTHDEGVTKVSLTRPPVTRIDPPGRTQLRGIDGDVIPVVRNNPDYPPRALAANIEGWVQVQFSVTATGAVRDATVVASEPGTIFDEAALKAIARWRYNPRVEAGVAVERVGLQTLLRFELEN